jgi:thiol-disulfide isomerase/thioredoxin
MLLIGFVAVFAVIVQSCQSPKTGIDRFAVGSLQRLAVRDTPPPQPKLGFIAADETQMSLNDYRGKVVLLNVWATWCPPCVKEMPALDELQKMRGGDDFEVITVSVDRNAEEPAAFFETHNIENLIPWHDTSYSLPAEVMAPGLPVSIFYDKRGREVARVFGDVEWTSKEVSAFVDYLTE